MSIAPSLKGNCSSAHNRVQILKVSPKTANQLQRPDVNCNGNKKGGHSRVVEMYLRITPFLSRSICSKSLILDFP